MKKAL